MSAELRLLDSTAGTMLPPAVRAAKIFGVTASATAAGAYLIIFPTTRVLAQSASTADVNKAVQHLRTRITRPLTIVSAACSAAFTYAAVSVRGGAAVADATILHAAGNPRRYVHAVHVGGVRAEAGWVWFAVAGAASAAAALWGVFVPRAVERRLLAGGGRADEAVVVGETGAERKKSRRAERGGERRRGRSESGGGGDGAGGLYVPGGWVIAGGERAATAAGRDVVVWGAVVAGAGVLLAAAAGAGAVADEAWWRVELLDDVKTAGSWAQF